MSPCPGPALLFYSDLRPTYSPAVLALGGAALHNAVHVLHYVILVAYVALGVVTFLFWRRRRDRPTMWAAIAFGSLGLLELLTLIPNHAGNLPERAVGRVMIALLVVFPYFLFRFTNAFRAANRRLANALFLLSAILVVWTSRSRGSRSRARHATARFRRSSPSSSSTGPCSRSCRPGACGAPAAHSPPWHAGEMQFLALATGLLTLALLLAVFTTRQYSGLSLGSNLLAMISVVAFLLGFAPPQMLRILWRAPEQARVQQAIASLLTFASSQQEVASACSSRPRTSSALARSRFATATAASWPPGTCRRASGRSSSRGPEVPALWKDATVVDIPVADGSSMVVWTSPYAPVFGDEELRLLTTLGALTGLALDRVRLFQAEHEARIALERADEVKTNFIALAAHELRTPMTTIHGFVTTLHHLADRLDDEQRDIRRASLCSSRRNAWRRSSSSCSISRGSTQSRSTSRRNEWTSARRSKRSSIRRRSTRPSGRERRAGEHDRDRRSQRARAHRDQSGHERPPIRRPPVRVHAEQTDRHFRLSVEDSGSGRRTRVRAGSVRALHAQHRVARSTPGGTGLGLAIARSYARAHGGDLIYEDGVPHGACFRLVLPMPRKEPA